MTVRLLSTTAEERAQITIRAMVKVLENAGWDMTALEGFDLLGALREALAQNHLHLVHQSELPPDPGA